MLEDVENTNDFTTDGAGTHPRIHWIRWLVAAALSALGFLAVLLPLQAIEILHFRVYESRYDNDALFSAVVITLIWTAICIGVLIAVLGVLRDKVLHHYERPWHWWYPLAAAVPAAITVHVLEQAWLAALVLLVHIPVSGSTRERRYLWAGLLAALFLAAPFTDPVRQLYVKRVVRVFHFYRLRYMNAFIQARKKGHRGAKNRPYPSTYLQSIDELPVTPRELFLLGIVSLREDPWGRPYHFVTSRYMEDGWNKPDFGRWEADYSFASFGADGLRGGTGADADIFPENALLEDELPPPRPSPSIKPRPIGVMQEEALEEAASGAEPAP